MTASAATPSGSSTTRPPAHAGPRASGRSAASATLSVYRAGTANRCRPGRAAAVTVPGAVSGWAAAHLYSAEAMRSRIPWPRAFRRTALRGDGRDRVGVRSFARRRRARSVRRPGPCPKWSAPSGRSITRGSAIRYSRRRSRRRLEQISRRERTPLTPGDLARRVAEGAAEAGSRSGRRDLAAHRADWVTPLRVPYRRRGAQLPAADAGIRSARHPRAAEDFDVADSTTRLRALHRRGTPSRLSGAIASSPTTVLEARWPDASMASD